MRGANGDVVEQAEAARLGTLGVVAGWADGAESVAGFFVHHHIDRLDNRTGSETGGLKRAVADYGIIVEARFYLPAAAPIQGNAGICADVPAQAAHR